MKQTKYEIEFEEIDWQERSKWRDKALETYDNAMFCPGCRGLLTGLHENVRHFQLILNKKAAKMWKESNE